MIATALKEHIFQCMFGILFVVAGLEFDLLFNGSFIGLIVKMHVSQWLSVHYKTVYQSQS